MQHLPHAGTADRAFVADDDDVAGPDLPVLDGLEAVLLVLEHLRWSRMPGAVVAGQLDHAALGREVAVHDLDPAGLLERLVDRGDHPLAGRLPRGRGDL